MQIIDVSISNYRNLDGVKIAFDPEVNFLIGENELGKSNLLDLFDVLLNHRQFSDEDFTKTASPIRIEFSLRLSEAEQGTFEDYFSPDNNNIINVSATQEYSDLDEDIVFFWQEKDNPNPIEIPSSLFRRVNYVAYDSLRVPQDELTFYRGQGSGRFLRYLINQLVGPEIQLGVDHTMEPVVAAIQSIFSRVEPLRQQGLGLYTGEEDSTELASRVLKLSGVGGFDIQKSGCGIQFSALLLLSIFERLVRLKQNKRFRPFEEKRDYFTEQEYKVFREMYFPDPTVESILQPIVQHANGEYHIGIEQLSDEDRASLGDGIIHHIEVRKRISMILGLDEPEIHLHPYMQRSLVKYICGLLENRDADFLFLLKNYFGIDAIDGQVLIVSHSPTILFDRYEHIVRFCRDNGVVVAISGSGLKLDPQVEKHLLLNFPCIKEAFFSRCVIVAEGETESGALPLWANEVIGDLDTLGITVICVGGYESVPTVVNLLNHFKIPNVSVIDKDVSNDTNPKFTSVDGLRTTRCRDFEEELVEAVCSRDPKATVLFDFLQNYGSNGLSRYARSSRLAKVASDYTIAQTWDTKQYTFEDVKDSSDLGLIKAMFLSWLTGDKTGKSITLGRALGQFIGTEFIPETYKTLFVDAKAKLIPT